jgi:26S proteasome regulatory subunit T5
MSDIANITEQIGHLTNDEIQNRIKMFENNMKQYKLEGNKVNHDLKKVDLALQDNKNKIKQNKQLPWLVSNVVEILDI